MDKIIPNTNEEDKIREDAKKKALEAIKKQKAVIVNIDDLAEKEARKAADERMTESKESLKGFKGLVKKIWKHTFFDEYYRQKEVNKVRAEIKEKDNIYTGRDIDRSGHEQAMGAISERFISDYEGTLSSGEEKKVLESTKNEDKENVSKIQNLIKDYASGNLDEEAFQSEKIRILDEVYKDKDEKIKKKKPEHNYTDNLFEIAKNARIAIEHGAKMEELELDTNIILGKAKSSLKTEAHFNKVDQITDKMKKSKLGRFVSPAVLNTSVGLAYSLSVGLGLKALNSKVAKIGTFGASVAVSSIFAGMNESQRITLERAQHGVEMAEGGKFEKDSKKREQMEQFAYKMESSQVLASKLRGLMFEMDKNGKDIPKDIKAEDLEKIFSTLADIEARNSLNDKNRIDLISYSGIANVEKERTDLTILVARAKAELKKKLSGDLKGKLNGKDFNTYLSEQVEVVEKTLLGGESGITAQDKAFKKFKTKEVAKKVAKTAIMGLVIGGTVQETVAFFRDDVQGFAEGFFHKDGGNIAETPFESLKNWISGNPSHVGLEGAVNHLVGGHSFNLPPGFSVEYNGDGTYDILRGDNVVSDNIKLTFDTNGNLDAQSIARLGQDGIIANTAHHMVSGITEGEVSAEEYIKNHPGSTHQIAHDGWYDNDTPKPMFDQNELRLEWGGVAGSAGIENGNYVLDVSHMTSDGSFHQEFSVDAQDKIREGGLKMILSLTKGTQNHVFEVPIDVNGKAIIDPNSEIGKLFFSTENGNAVFKGQYAEVVESFGSKNGVEHVKTLATLVGEGNNSIMDKVSTLIDNPIVNLDPSVETEPPYFIPIMSRRPLESLIKEKDAKEDSTNKEDEVNKRVSGNKKINYLSNEEEDAIFQKKVKKIRDSKGSDYIMTQKDVLEARKEANIEIENINKSIKKERVGRNVNTKKEDNVSENNRDSNNIESPFTKEDLSKVGTEFKTESGSYKVINVKQGGFWGSLFGREKVQVVFTNKSGEKFKIEFKKKDLEREFKNGRIEITKRG